MIVETPPDEPPDLYLLPTLADDPAEDVAAFEDEPAPWLDPAPHVRPAPAGPELATSRDLFLRAYAELEAAGGPGWSNGAPEERAALAHDLVAGRSGLVDSLARAGFSGPGAVAAYLEAVAEMAAPPAARVHADAGDAPGTATIGDQTAADLRHGMPPEQLAGAFLTPEGPTIVYARGGTGKGLVTCWLIAQLVRAGHVVMVLDYEGHEREWGSRLRGIGLADEDLRQVHYRAPFGPEWTAPTGALSAVAPAVREDCARLDVSYLVVDSYSVATSNGDTMGGEQAAREYFTALATIGLPSLTIAHVRGDSSRFPERPFGSVFVHNLARETWAAEKLGETGGDLIGDDYAPAVVSLELRNQKANGRGRAPAQFVAFSFYADGSITTGEDGPPRRAISDLAADVLAEGPMTLRQIVAAIKEDGGDVSEDTLRSALRRHPGRFTEAAAGRPRKWSAA